MAFFDGVVNLFNGKSRQNRAMARLLNDEPIFSQFGGDIYASDVVQNCIDVIATEISKLSPTHVRVDNNQVQSTPKGSLNRLFKVSPNIYMTTRDFLEKIIWLLFLNYNCFIYPVYEVYLDAKGSRRKNFVAMYPLDPTQVVFEEDESGKLFAHFYFKKGDDYTVPYEDIIHLRKKFSMNDIMGGGYSGQPDNSALMKILEINDTAIQGVGKAIKTSLSIRGILKINYTLNGDDIDKERERFEAKIAAGDSGILPMDTKSEYTPITSDPKTLDKDTLDFLDQKVLRWYGVSLPIITGDFTDEQYQAFYEKTLEPILIGLGQAFTKALFSPREIDIGNEIVFYQKNMMYLSTGSKLDIIKITGEQGLLTNDQKLLLLGYPPLGGEEGAKRTQSLNYVDTKMATAYQMGNPPPVYPNSNGGTANGEG